MGQTECKFNVMPDICNIGACLETLQGIESNSASPTDVWRLTMKKGTAYKNMPVVYAWLKLFISNATKPMKLTDGLMYELRVYRDVVKPLMEKRICPNFVRYLASAEACTLDQVSTIVESQGLTRWHLLRSVHYMEAGLKYRPSINAAKTNTKFNENPGFRFGMIMTEDLESVPLNDWKAPNDHAYVCMVLQLLVALRAMELSKFTHNDMHFGNVLIALFSNRANVRYDLDDFTMTLAIDFKVMVFDFDRAHVNWLGHNTLIDRHKCYSKTFVPYRDLASVVCSLLKRASVSQGLIIEKAFNIKAGEFMVPLQTKETPTHAQFRMGQYRLEDGTPATVSNSFLKFDCVPSELIKLPIVDTMRNLYSALRDMSPMHELETFALEPDFHYVCNKTMFDSDGRILV